MSSLRTTLIQSSQVIRKLPISASAKPLPERRGHKCDVLRYHRDDCPAQRGEQIYQKSYLCYEPLEGYVIMLCLMSSRHSCHTRSTKAVQKKFHQKQICQKCTLRLTVLGSGENFCTHFRALLRNKEKVLRKASGIITVTECALTNLPSQYKNAKRKISAKTANENYILSFFWEDPMRSFRTKFNVVQTAWGKVLQAVSCSWNDFRVQVAKHLSVFGPLVRWVE